MLFAMKLLRSAAAVMIALALTTGCSREDKPKPDDAPLFLEGVVLRDGEPAKGVKIDVQLWPETDDAEIGDAVDLFDADSSRSGSDGTFTVRLDPEDVPSRYFGGDSGYVNFDMWFTDGPHLTTWGGTLWAINDDTWRTDGGNAADTPLRVEIDLGRERITLTDSQGEAVTSDLPLGEMHQ